MARAIRILVYEGPENWLEKSLGSSIRGEIKFGNGAKITEVFRTFDFNIFDIKEENKKEQ